MLKCKFCSTKSPDIVELRGHVQKAHLKQWRLHSQQMARFDEEHKEELSKTCPICPHRKSGHGHTD